VQLFAHVSDAELLRLIHKFREKNFEKIEKLVELHVKYFNSLEENDRQETILRKQNDLPEETPAERYARRLENGLYTLQMIDITIGFLWTLNDPEIRERVAQVLNRNDMDIDEVKMILTEYSEVSSQIIASEEDENKNSNDNDNDNNNDNDSKNKNENAIETQTNPSEIKSDDQSKNPENEPVDVDSIGLPEIAQQLLTLF